MLVNSKTNNPNLFKRKMFSICLIAISYITIIVKIKDLASVRYPDEFIEKIAYFLGAIIGVSVVPLVISLAVIAFNKFIRKKENNSFLLIFSIMIFIWVIYILARTLI